MNPPSGRVLIIAGSDSGGGAGIQGDLKTVQALGGFGMTAITALTAQNTLRVSDVFPVPPAFIAEQITMCLSDIGADAMKTGMLHSEAVIRTVADHIPATIPLVVDPVMLAKGGSPLLEASALDALKSLLIPRATVLTPNLPEAELLLGEKITADTHIDAARALLKLGSQSVLLKGGHGEGELLTDVLVAADIPPVTFTVKRIDTLHTHGTGCSFASAIATGLAQGLPLVDAVARAHAYVQQAIARAPGFGQGHGPLGH
jgi:hydroxymethylpyrimidine/phosphomethylpyrimidine kinase